MPYHYLSNKVFAANIQRLQFVDGKYKRARKHKAKWKLELDQCEKLFIEHCQLLVERLQSKMDYIYNDYGETSVEAIAHLWKCRFNFKTEKNCFNYATTVVLNCCRQLKRREVNQLKIKDKLMFELSPLHIKKYPN